MNSWFNSLWQPVSIGILGWIGGWLHHALTIRPNQLEIKAKLPPAVKDGLQNVVDAVVPQVANLVESDAQKVLATVASKVVATPVVTPPTPGA